MASSQSRGAGGGERMIHQDFIARIRYSNALPPPPNPPKLLDIPNTGLASGLYTTPGFASRLAREQPLNIEADAELGMPLDLVGMPGIFDGDESSIQAPAQPPPVHPHDRPLLRPLSTLGKPKASDSAVSFLRRTEYISSATVKARPADVFLRSSSGNRRPEKRKVSPEPDKDSPAYMRRKIARTFDVAGQRLKERSRVKHPSKPNLRLVDAYPLLPDLEAFPDSGAYVTVKFTHNPVPSSGTYDTRILSGIFKPIERTEAEDLAFEAAMEAHERDPAHHPKPNNMMNYDFYLAANTATGERFRARFDVDNAARNSDELYDGGDGERCFQFARVRAYETAQETELDHPSKYDDEIVLAYNDGEKRQKAAFYYPVMQRSTIRSQRTKNIARTVGIQPEQEQIVDQLDVTVDDPSDEVVQRMLRFKEEPLGFQEDEDEEQGGDKASPKREENGGAQANSTANGGAGGRGTGGADEDVDAEGEEDEE